MKKWIHASEDILKNKNVKKIEEFITDNIGELWSTYLTVHDSVGYVLDENYSRDNVEERADEVKEFLKSNGLNWKVRSFYSARNTLRPMRIEIRVTPKQLAAWES